MGKKADNAQTDLLDDAEQPEAEESSLDDELRAAFAEQEAAGDDTADDKQETAASADDDASDEAESDDDESAGDAPEASESDEDEGEEAGEATDEDEGDDEPGEAVTAPEDWSAEDKAAFEKLPQEGRDVLLRTHKNLVADYTRKTTEIAPLRKALDPFRGEMQKHGLDEAQAMQHITSRAMTMFQYEQALQQNPKAVIQQLAKQYGVEFGSESDTSTDYVDPEVKRLQAKIDALEGKVVQTETQRQQAQQQEIQTQLDRFAADHPYFDDLKVTMGALMQAGRASTLDEAYEMAQWSHSDIRQKILDQQQAEAAKKAAEDRKRKVKTARNASVGVKTKGKQAPTPEPETSLAEDLQSAFSSQTH